MQFKWCSVGKYSSLIACAGTGGTGKTTVLEALAKRFTEMGLEFVVFPSVVREYYGMHNVASEADFLALSPHERFAFQLGLMEFFKERLEALYVNKPRTVPIICDRSIFDHYMYILYYSSSLFLMADYEILQRNVAEYILKLMCLIYFPYPTPWSQDVDPDSFRWAPPGKNLVCDAIIYRLIERFAYSEDQIHLECTPVETRVDTIIAKLKSWGYIETKGEE